MAQRLNEEMLAAMEDDALAEIAVGMKEDAGILHGNAGLALFVLRKRMETAKATALLSDAFDGKLAAGPWQHKIEDPEALYTALSEHVPTEVLDQSFTAPSPPARSWNQTGLNNLKKLGGKVLATIDEYRQSGRGESVLTLKRKDVADAD